MSDRNQWEGWLNKEKCERLLKRWGSYEEFTKFDNPKNKNKKEFVDALFQVIGKCKGRPTITEIGCGTGHFLWAIKDKVASMTGVDYSIHMLELCKNQFDKAGRQIELLEGSCWDIPLEPNYSTIVFMIDVTMHIGGTWPALKEMIRVAKKYVLLTGPSFENFDDTMEKQKDKISWAISLPLLKKELKILRKSHAITGYEFLERPKTNVYNHKILVIEK